MDHMVRISTQEYLELLAGERKMILRGGFWRKPPFQRVFTGDVLYLLDKHASHTRALRAEAARVFHARKKFWTNNVPGFEHAGMKKSDRDLLLFKQYAVLIELKSLGEVDSISLPNARGRWTLGAGVCRESKDKIK